MPSKRIQEVVQELSFEKKLVGIGSLLMVISAFLPWYQDLDSFKTGDMFLGITGPLYLAGFSLFLLAASNLGVLWMDANEKKLPFSSFKNTSIYLFSGIFAFYMLMVVNSVYFHPSFGLNITMKQSQFGMFFAFIAASFLTIGGYLSGRDKVTLMKEFQDEAQPMVKTEQHRPKENLRPAMPRMQKEEPAKQIHMVQEPQQKQHAVPVGTVPAEPAHNDEEKKNYQPYRIDL